MRRELIQKRKYCEFCKKEVLTNLNYCPICKTNLRKTRKYCKSCERDIIVESNICPICKKEVLLPFSISGVQETKAFGHWICTNCGFYIGTGSSRGGDPVKDITTGFHKPLVQRVEQLRKNYLSE